MKSLQLLFIFGILLLSNPIHASDWYTDTVPSEDAYFAITLNDTGNVFGEFCFKKSESCLYLLGMHIACKSGNQYPVLVNSDSGSFSLTVYCFDQADNGLYRYGFTNFDEIKNIVNNSSKIGFAFPMKGDQFKVIRFSLKGANEAINRMRGDLRKRFKNSSSKSEENL